MPGSVDDVDAVLIELLLHALPKTGRRCGGDRNTTLLFLLHPVHGGRTIVYLTDLMRETCIKQYPLSGGGLTSIHVGNNTDITITVDRSLTSHDSVLRLRLAD